MIWYVLDMFTRVRPDQHDMSNENVDLKIDFQLKWELMDLRCNLSLFSQLVYFAESELCEYACMYMVVSCSTSANVHRFHFVDVFHARLLIFCIDWCFANATFQKHWHTHTHIIGISISTVIQAFYKYIILNTFSVSE